MGYGLCDTHYIVTIEHSFYCYIENICSVWIVTAGGDCYRQAPLTASDRLP